MWGAVACTDGVLAEAETDISKLKDHPLFEGMLVCHSLTFIDGALYGDPLDAKVEILFHRDRSLIRHLDVMTHTSLHIIDVRKYQVDIDRFGFHACK